MKPTVARLRQLLRYAPTTGRFRWHTPSAHQAKGWFRGNKSVRQYRRLWIDDHHYLAHVIAWALKTGAWPKNEIDHRDGDQSNNRWSNLRAATRQQNPKNRKKNKNNTTGISGVSQFNGRFRATIGVDHKVISLGLYDTVESAANARKAAEKKWYGEWAHQGL